MKIKQFKVAVIVGNIVQTIDGLEYEEKLWLVSQWADNLQEKISRPMRMIRFDLLEFSSIQHPNPHHFALTRPIPIGVLPGESNEGHEILEGNNIPFGFPFSPHGTVFH